MSNIQVQPVVYGSWGKCLRVTNGTAEFIATLDLGPRIIRYGFCDGPNLFFEDEQRTYFEEGEGYEQVEGRWHLFGGHRLWTSPQAPGRASYPDNEPIDWQQIDRGVILTASTERWNQVQKQIEITMDEADTRVNVIHRVTNRGPWPISFSIWALTVMAGGGAAIVPQATRDSGPLPNRSFYLWPNTHFNDPRMVWKPDCLIVRQEQRPWMKFGMNNEAGWAAYLLNGQLFIKQYTHHTTSSYPNSGASFELYTNDRFLELESLGELVEVGFDQTISHTETWQILDQVPDDWGLEHGREQVMPLIRASLGLE
jgi:hypothetical protein